MAEWGIFRLSMLDEKVHLDIPREIKNEISRCDFLFPKSPQIHLNHGCINILGEYFVGTTAPIISALEDFIDCQPIGTNMTPIRDPVLAAAIYSAVNFRLPIQHNPTTLASESYLSHRFWSPLLTGAVDETKLQYNWEVMCREGF